MNSTYVRRVHFARVKQDNGERKCSIFAIQIFLPRRQGCLHWIVCACDDALKGTDGFGNSSNGAMKVN